MKASDKQQGGDHYKRMGVQPWDVINTWPLEQQIGAHRAAALGYIMRAGSKGPVLEEIQKAHHTLEKLIEVLGENDGPKSGDKFTIDVEGKRYSGVFPKICPANEMNCTQNCGEWCRRVVGERVG